MTRNTKETNDGKPNKFKSCKDPQCKEARIGTKIPCPHEAHNFKISQIVAPPTFELPCLGCQINRIDYSFIKNPKK